LVTCKDFLRELSEFLDDATDPQTRKELEQHITQCPNCWVILDTTKKTIQVYKGMEAQPLPEAVHDRLMNALEKKCGSGVRRSKTPEAQA
jgi:anti-sigma factor RsiW